MMKLSILIVNYNTELHIRYLLDQLRDQTLGKNEFEVVITNNVQNDALDNVILEFSSELNLRVVASPHNVGFGRANNMAALAATGDHLLITNPDIRMLQDDYLERLLDISYQHPGYGAITTKVLNDHNEDTSEYYHYEFGRTLGYDNQICWFSGALILMRKEVFEELGGFDPDFFMYCEDVDLSYRIKKLGLPLIKINEISAHHIGGASEPERGYDLFYRWYRSQILFALKHFPPEEFEELLSGLNKKSRAKHRKYSVLRALGMKKVDFKLTKYKAMLDVTQRTLDESTSWLYFKI